MNKKSCYWLGIRRIRLFLPYLILKRSKRIKKSKFEKLLDDNYRIQDTITLKTTDYL